MLLRLWSGASLDVLEDRFTSSEGLSFEKGWTIKSRKQDFCFFQD